MTDTTNTAAELDLGQLEKLEKLASRAQGQTRQGSVALFLFAVLTAIAAGVTLTVAPLDVSSNLLWLWLPIGPLGFSLLWLVDVTTRRSLGLRQQHKLWSRTLAGSIGWAVLSLTIFFFGTLSPATIGLSLQSLARKQRNTYLRFVGMLAVFFGVLCGLAINWVYDPLFRVVAISALPLYFLVTAALMLQRERER